MSKVSYRKYHRDKTYSENESLFKNIFMTRFNIAKRFVKKGRILDIGTSTGTMLDIFAEQGYETWGVEPSGSAKVAKSKGHKILNSYFEKAKLPKNYFDLVILNHTLEHMDEPVEVLEKIFGILKKSGIVYIDVPNAGGLGSVILRDKWPYRLPEEHKHQFTKQSLEELFRKAGFGIIHFESRSGIFEFANPLEELKESLFGLKKRFLKNVINIPYDLLVTAINIGDSMSMVGRK